MDADASAGMPPVAVEGGWTATKETQGEFAGWYSWSRSDPFEAMIGPFFSRRDGGQPVCAFRAEPRHMNGGATLHGGCMLSFADYALFALSLGQRGRGPAVTVSLNADFLGPGRAGDRIEARGEVTRSGKSLTFVRGLLTADQRPALSFSGVLKTLRPGPIPR